MMDNGLIEIDGLAQLEKKLYEMTTDNPEQRKRLQGIIKKAIGDARKRVAADAKDVLEDDPRAAYKAVRYSVYKKIFGGQVNILPNRRRGMPTSWQRPRQLDQNPHQRGGNRMHRSQKTMRSEGYYGKDRGFVLRFVNAGTSARESRYGNRGSITERKWFSLSSTAQMYDAIADISEMIEVMLKEEFSLQ